ncbi:hypothetical protein [Rhizobium sp. NFR03]|uniref:hypothetical protein n=1 Tax=Rhizobium sp. NFR03 TaxID=1566263 RepID=UPI0008BABBF5|nr:hypothetical protein [Rhizobium sp. NFR03]SER58473.1 hypothetical protein SAMN03159406_00575 [Rhizobium sp. NFR03]
MTATRDRLIGNLLDRWEMTPNDLKQEMREHSCGKQLDELLSHVEAPPPQPNVVPIELDGVSRALENGDGVWRSCSGCHELDEGVATGSYSDLMRCHLGIGCSECGGIGAIWDTTDYAEMGEYIALTYPDAPQPTKPIGYIPSAFIKHLRDGVQGKIFIYTEPQPLTVALYVDPPRERNVRQLDWSNFAGPKRNAEWKPDDQDLIYTAINFRDDEWGDADEDAGQQIVERLLQAWQEAEMAAAHYAHHRRELLDAVQPATQTEQQETL